MDSYSLRRQDSTETLASLIQLDPSPIDSEQDLPGMVDEALARKGYRTSTYSSLGLSGSGGGSGSIYYLTRIQRYSSYTFSVFAGLHLANTSIIPLIYRSVPYSEPFLVMAREIYQTPLTEPLLIGLPVLAHVASGLALRLVRRKQNLRRYGNAAAHQLVEHRGQSRSWAWPPLSNISASGYLFLGLLAAHVAVNRAVPLIVEGDSSNVGLQYVAHGFARAAPYLQVQAWPSYAALVYFAAGHMVWGWAKWFGVAPVPLASWQEEHALAPHVRRRRRRAWWAVQGSAVAVAALWAAGGLGVVAKAGRAGGWLGSVYDGMYGFAWQ